MGRRIRHIPDQAVDCLNCACLNLENAAVVDLLTTSAARTATGVIAAIYVANHHDHCELVSLTRQAIFEQRRWCREHGGFRLTECRRAEAIANAPALPRVTAESAMPQHCVCTIELPDVLD